MKFTELKISSFIISNLDKNNISEMTPVQEQSLPYSLKGRDVIAQAQTGTGKTISFIIPIIEKLLENTTSTNDALILAPTRELALQIYQDFVKYVRGSKLKVALLTGGESYKAQFVNLARGIDIVVATPGRLTDLMEKGAVALENTKTFVLDEVDQMLDIGFHKDIVKIEKLTPRKKQTLFYSATIENKIMRLAEGMTLNPARVVIKPEEVANRNIDQKIMFVDRKDKRDLLVDLINETKNQKTIIFTRTRREADEIQRLLWEARIRADAIHSEKKQSFRKAAIARFKEGRINILIATDVAARGIDVKDLDLVINYALPDEAEYYVHRIGRTGRAGKTGISISLVAQDEAFKLFDIQKMIKMQIEVVEDHKYHTPIRISEKKSKEKKRRDKKVLYANKGRKDFSNRNFDHKGGKRVSENNKNFKRNYKGNGDQRKDYSEKGGQKKDHKNNNNYRKNYKANGGQKKEHKGNFYKKDKK